MIRLNKYIASSGSTSRRKADELIAAGRVTVNGKIVDTVGITIDPERDAVAVDNHPIVVAEAFTYLALNKPVGVVCTRAQIRGEKTVYDLIPNSRGLIIAGRLDKDSEGLVLLTNDGELVNTLTHPKYRHEKEYEVTLSSALDEEALRTMKTGIKMTEGIARFDRMTPVAPSAWRVVIHQGWKRQIRRMFAAVHGHVIRLVRVRLHRLELGDLPTGRWRNVERRDITGRG